MRSTVPVGSLVALALIAHMAVSLYCPHCKKHTALSVAPAEYEGDFGGMLHTDAIWRKGDGQKWWIGVCNGCKEPSLILNDGATIYPQPLPSRTDPNIPKELARDLEEAKMCFSVRCYRACTVMARRSIQNACILKGATENTLVTQINELAQQGVITKDIEEWAHVVRWVVNDAAPPGKVDVTKEDADDCLRLAEQLLHVMFVTPAIAKARRTARGE